MILNSEIIKNEIFKYEFIKQFLKGNILDHKSNNFTLYHSAKILLENKVDKVYSLLNLSDNELNLRKLDNKNSIIFNNDDNRNLELKFDGVISFQNINKKNCLKNIEFYHKALKNKGILVFSVSNKRKKNKINDKINQFSIDEIKNEIDSKFEIEGIFSQRNIEKAVVNYKAVFLRKMKKKLAEILKKLGIIRKIYIKNVKKTVSKYDPYKQYFHKIPDKDFIVKKYEKNQDPMFLVFICKKK